MSREDERSINHLGATFHFIAVLVAAPFGWFALTSNSQTADPGIAGATAGLVPQR